MTTSLRPALGVFLVLIGLLWMGQGVGWIGGSFMTGDVTWLVVGALVAVGGVVLVLTSRRARRDR